MVYKAERDKEIWSDATNVSEQVSIVVSVHQYDGGEPKLRIGRFLNNYGKVQSYQPIKLGGITLDELYKISELIDMGKTVLKEIAKPMIERKGDYLVKIDIKEKIKEALVREYGADSVIGIREKERTEA